MKLKPVLWTAALLCLAALFGWLLPAVVFPERENAVEEAPAPVAIRGIDLSYESDLSTADRMRLIREFQHTTVSLEHGFFQRREEVWSIADAFLYDLTGRSFSVSADTCSAEPLLVSFHGSGSFVVWHVGIVLDRGWVFEAVFDDQTGALLQCSLESHGGNWDLLFPGIWESEDQIRYLLGRFRDSFSSQLRRRLSADWSLREELLEINNTSGDSVLHVLENGELIHDVPLIVYLPAHHIALNW